MITFTITASDGKVDLIAERGSATMHDLLSVDETTALVDQLKKAVLEAKKNITLRKIELAETIASKQEELTALEEQTP